MHCDDLWLEDPIFVFFTGFANDTLAAALSKEGVRSCHLKPIAMETLTDILSEKYNFE